MLLLLLFRRYVADIDDEAIQNAMDNVSVGELKQLGRKAFMGGSNGRAQLLDTIKDHAINFLLDALPKIKVPPIEGKRDATPIAGAPPIGIKYRVWDIDLSQLQIDKRHVRVSFGGSKKPKEDGSNPTEPKAQHLQFPHIAHIQ